MCGRSSALYSMILILCGSICFSLFIIPITLEHLSVTLSEWFFFNLDSSPKLIREIEIAQLCFFSNLDSSPKLIREIEIAQLCFFPI